MNLNLQSIFLLFFLFSSRISLGQSDNHLFKIYNAQGVETSYEDMMTSLKQNDLIFLGELHNDPISHWFQMKILKEFNKKFGQDVILGFEMFEADDQYKIDEYLSGRISERSFEAETRLWNNYKTDYKPVFNYAKENGISIVATNIPRRYASLVYRENLEGLETLGDLQKSFIAPLPIAIDTTLNSYQKLMGGGGMSGHGGGKSYLMESQAIKDATMADRIMKYYTSGKKFIHLNGSYHSDYKEGIVSFIDDSIFKITNVTTVKVKDINTFDEDNIGKADFIILLDEDMTTSY